MNDDQNTKRRSATSKTTLIGDSQIPSALGQTITGALANIPFPFGIDPTTGEYGYKKAGADTVTPFKSGCTRVVIATSVGSQSARQFNIATALPDVYKTLSLTNFAATDVIMRPYTSASAAYTNSIFNSYNSTTGILYTNVVTYYTWDLNASQMVYYTIVCYY